MPTQACAGQAAATAAAAAVIVGAVAALLHTPIHHAARAATAACHPPALQQDSAAAAAAASHQLDAYETAECSFACNSPALQQEHDAAAAELISQLLEPRPQGMEGGGTELQACSGGERDERKEGLSAGESGACCSAAALECCLSKRKGRCGNASSHGHQYIPRAAVPTCQRVTPMSIVPAMQREKRVGFWRYEACTGKDCWKCSCQPVSHNPCKCMACRLSRPGRPQHTGSAQQSIGASTKLA